MSRQQEPHPLKALRKAHGLSQRQLAERASVSVGTVTKIESDARLAHGLTLARVARALDVSVMDVAGPNQQPLADELASATRSPDEVVAAYFGLPWPDAETQAYLARLREELAR